MSNNIEISASIVLYNEDIPTLEKTINCFLSVPCNKKLYLIDNTPTSNFKGKFTCNNDIEYIENKKNVGFGTGHNTVLPFIKNNSITHLILNPDVFFTSDIISILCNTLLESNSIAMIAPAVKFPDGRKQYTIRKYPNIIDLFSRKFGLFEKRNSYQEYRYKDLTKPLYPEAIHGCFMLFRTSDFIALKGFDERYFLYMEDIDICRKIDEIGKKKMYFPSVEITHVLKKQSSKDFKMFFLHLNSVIKYFLKWKYNK